MTADSLPRYPLKKFRSRRSGILKPGSHLKPGLQNLFQLHYLPAGKEVLPSGWSILSDEAAYPALSTRVTTEAEDEDSAGDYAAPNGGNSESESNEELPRVPTRMVDEPSSEEDVVQSRVSLGPVQFFR